MLATRVESSTDESTTIDWTIVTQRSRIVEDMETWSITVPTLTPVSLLGQTEKALTDD
jgi:hypothetical protein